MYLLGIVAVLLITFSGCSDGFGKKVVGGVDVKDSQVLPEKNVHAPRIVYVTDFRLFTGDLEREKGVRGVLPGGLGERIGRIGERLPHPLADNDPRAKSREIVDSLSSGIVEALQDKGIEAKRYVIVNDRLPRDGWLVRGVFTEVDEGSRIKRAGAGFGSGDTKMNVQVGICDLAGDEPHKAFAVFGTVKEPDRIPGAAVTRNPYVAAAKFVMEKNSTARDVKKTAKQIADEIAKFRDRFS